MARPTIYSDEVRAQVESYFDNYQPWYESPVEKQLKDGSTETRMERLPNPPPSILDLARELDIARSTLYLWMDAYPAFSDTIKRGIERLYPEVLQENAMLGRYSNAFAIFAAKNRMKWTDKQELSGPEGGPVQFSCTINLVRPNGASGQG